VKPIILLPLGDPDRTLVTGLSPAIRKAFRVSVEVEDARIDLAPFYDDARGQYNSTSLIFYVREHVAPAFPGAALLAVVPHDLFIPILTFVFGEAEFEGTVAAVSHHRLDNRRYGLPPDRALLEQRLEKEALHELGHIYGLFHCRSGRCVMRTSTSVEEIDLKEGEFCASCRAALKRAS
jgi:archaemetzincin